MGGHMTIPRRIGLLCCIVILCLISVQRSAYGAPATSGIGVSPAIETIDLTPHQTSSSFVNVVSNDSLQPIDVEASTSGFIENGSNGSLQFTDQVPAGNSLHENLTLSSEAFSVPAHGSVSVTVTIHDADKLAPGGHYGAVLYKVIGSVTTGASGGAPTVSLRQTVASLIFVSTAGSGTTSLKLLPVNHPIAFFHLPDSYDLSFHNAGNTIVVPQGSVLVSGPYGYAYSKGIINDGSAIVLPATTRLLQTPVSKLSPAWLPGKYTAHVVYRAAGSNTYLTSTVTFWYINLGGMACIIFVFIFVFLIFYLFRHRISRKVAKQVTKIHY